MILRIRRGDSCGFFAYVLTSRRAVQFQYNLVKGFLSGTTTLTGMTHKLCDVGSLFSVINLLVRVTFLRMHIWLHCYQTNATNPIRGIG